MLIIVIGHGQQGNGTPDPYVQTFTARRKKVDPDRLDQVLLAINEKYQLMPKDINNILIIKNDLITNVYNEESVAEYVVAS